MPTCTTTAQSMSRMAAYPIEALYPQADDKTAYARSIGYQGNDQVFVLDGKVISHRWQDWFDFCATQRNQARSREQQPQQCG